MINYATLESLNDITGNVTDVNSKLSRKVDNDAFEQLSKTVELKADSSQIDEINKNAESIFGGESNKEKWSIFDWDGDGKRDILDDFLEYNLCKACMEDDDKNESIFDSDDDFVTYNSVVCGAALYSDWRMREKCGQLNTTPYNRLTILNRTPHKYTVEYSNGEFCEIVPRNAPDGIYSAEFIPIKIEDDGTFCIGKFGVYQGESTLLTHSEGREIVFEKELTDKLYSHGRKQKNINILLSLEIKVIPSM